MTKIIAHRGASAAAPENTLAAFQLALDVHADGIELDIHLSKDGIPVVSHDSSLQRTTGSLGKISDFTALELQQYDVGSWFDQRFSKERLPLLQEVLELCATIPKFLLNIELKAGSKLYPGIEERTLEVVANSPYKGDVIYSSFDHYALSLLKQINPKARTGVLYSAALYQPWRYRGILCFDALHPAWHTLTPEIIRRAQEEMLEVNTYTVDDLFYAQQLLNCKVDGIITNIPDQLLDLRRINSKPCFNENLAK